MIFSCFHVGVQSKRLLSAGWQRHNRSKITFQMLDIGLGRQLEHVRQGLCTSKQKICRNDFLQCSWITLELDCYNFTEWERFLICLTHSLIHHFESIPISMKLQMTTGMWLLKFEDTDCIENIVEKGEV